MLTPGVPELRQITGKQASARSTICSRPQGYAQRKEHYEITVEVAQARDAPRTLAVSHHNPEAVSFAERLREADKPQFTASVSRRNTVQS